MKIRTQSIGLPVIPFSVALPLVAGLVPLCIPGPQIVVGVIINTLLVVYALRLSSKSYIMMCVMPSVGSIGNGLLFGTFTPFLIYFAPFIWIGNMVFVSSVRALPHANEFVRVGVGAMGKSTFLFLMALLLTRLHIVPQIFLTAMGTMQLITALIGGSIAIFFHKRL